MSAISDLRLPIADCPPVQRVGDRRRRQQVSLAFKPGRVVRVGGATLEMRGASVDAVIVILVSADVPVSIVQSEIANRQSCLPAGRSQIPVQATGPGGGEGVPMGRVATDGDNAPPAAGLLPPETSSQEPGTGRLDVYA